MITVNDLRAILVLTNGNCYINDKLRDYYDEDISECVINYISIEDNRVVRIDIDEVR